MKKVLSAVVLSAAVVATAGQAHAYGEFYDYEGKDFFNKGVLVQVLYNDEKEVIVNNGVFETFNYNAALGTFDHTFAPNQNKVLSTVDVQSYFAGSTSPVKVAYYIDDMTSSDPALSTRWDAYYVTTSRTHGGAPVVDPITGVTAGDGSEVPFQIFNQLSASFLKTIQDASQGFDQLVATGTPFADNMFFDVDYDAEGNPFESSTPGSYALMNQLNQAYGAGDLSNANASDYIDFYLWRSSHDTKSTGSTSDDVNLAGVEVATLRFNTVTGETILNPTETSPVPVPAAAWLLGSGLLGMFGLRRRNA